MLFEDLVDRVMLDLKLTSVAGTAADLVGEHINDAYREVMRKLGVDVYSRVEFDIIGESGTQEQTIDDTNDPQIQRIVAIYTLDASQATPSSSQQKFIPVEYIDYDEMKQTVPMASGTPTKWTRKRMGNNSITFLTDSLDPGQLFIEGEENTSELDLGDSPQFMESFHRILVDGAKALYLLNMEKPALSKVYRDKFVEGMNELALKTVIAKQQDIIQNRKARRTVRRGRLFGRIV